MTAMNGVNLDVILDVIDAWVFRVSLNSWGPRVESVQASGATEPQSSACSGTVSQVLLAQLS